MEPPTQPLAVVSAPPAPPSKAVVSPVVALVLRILTFICLLLSIIIIATAAPILRSDDTDFEIKIKFTNYYGYRYMIATAVIGATYTLLQIVLLIFQVRTGDRIGDLYQFDFYADKIVSYLLAMGAAVGIVLAAECRLSPINQSPVNLHFQSVIMRANAAAALLFKGFLFSGVSSIFSSLSLPKRS